MCWRRARLLYVEHRPARCGEIMRRRSARIEPYTDADVGQLSAEFAQVILQVIAIAQRKYYSKIAALESKVSDLRSSNQALELELAQAKSRVLAADRQASPVAEVASTLSSTDRPSLQRSSDSIRGRSTRRRAYGSWAMARTCVR